MNIRVVKKETKRIRITTEVDLGGSPGAENHRRQTDDYQEAPLPEFDSAICRLEEAAANACGILNEGLTVTGFSLRKTQGGTRSAMLHVTKDLGDEHEWQFKSPWFRIDPPQDGEDEALGCSKADAEAVAQAIHEAERYLSGKRAQGLLIDEQDSNTAGGDDMFGKEG